MTAIIAITIPFTGVMFLKRQWMLGKRFGFVTPGEMLSYYFKSDLIRVLVVIVALGELLMSPLQRESLAVDETGEVHDLTMRSFGIEREKGRTDEIEQHRAALWPRVPMLSSGRTRPICKFGPSNCKFSPKWKRFRANVACIQSISPCFAYCNACDPKGSKQKCYEFSPIGAAPREPPFFRCGAIGSHGGFTFVSLQPVPSVLHPRRCRF